MPNWLVSVGRWLIVNDDTRAFLLAHLRVALGIAGFWLVKNGWASNSMVQDGIGLTLDAIAFYGAHKDVSGVIRQIAVVQASTASTAAVAQALANAPKTDAAVDKRLEDHSL
jgi:hypothetical protein